MRQILLVLRYCVAMKGDVCFRLIRLWVSVSKETLHSQCFNRWKKRRFGFTRFEMFGFLGCEEPGETGGAGLDLR